MARLGALLVWAGLCSSIALQADHKPKQAAALPKPNKFVAGSGLVGGVAGGVTGYYVPQGTQGVNPPAAGAVNGALVGLATSMLPAIASRKVGTALASSIAGGTLGAGTGAGFAALKQVHLADAAALCTQITVQSNFNLTDYISAPWYPQWQNEQEYQKIGEMNCTSATYTQRTGWNFPVHDIDVRNYGLKDNGDAKDTGTFLCADQQDGAKLVVTPCMLPRTMGSPYWVATHDATAGTAIIIGGQPNKYNSATGKCGYQNPLQNGMWIFTRERTPDETVVSNLKTYMSDTLNLDTSAMVRTPQTACAGVTPPRKKKGAENE